MSTTVNDIEGTVILVALIEAKPGKGDDVAGILAAIKAVADSDKEPGCLTYRVTRFKDSFAVFEEYVDKAAIKLHMESTPFKAISGSGDKFFAGPPTIRFYSEIKDEVDGSASMLSKM